MLKVAGGGGWTEIQGWEGGEMVGGGEGVKVGEKPHCAKGVERGGFRCPERLEWEGQFGVFHKYEGKGGKRGVEGEGEGEEGGKGGKGKEGGVGRGA